MPIIYAQDLPPVLQELKSLIGLSAVLQLVKYYGGRLLFVPDHYDVEHRLNAIIGHENTTNIIKIYGGDRLYIAKAANALKTVRNIEISKKYESNTPIATLVYEYNLSERQIWNILKKPETLRESSRPDQGELFDY